MFICPCWCYSSIVVSSQCVSTYYYYHHYASCDSYVCSWIEHYYDWCNCFHFSWISWILIGIIIFHHPIYSVGHSEWCCWIHCCDMTTISSADGSTGPIVCCHSGLLCQLWHGSSTVKVFLWDVSFPMIFLCWCYSVYFLISVSSVASIYTIGTSTVLVVLLQPFGTYP